MGLSLKSIQILQLMQNAVMWAVNGVSYLSHVTSLLCKLYFFPVCFWVQFKVLVVTFKALLGVGWGYLPGLFPVVFTPPTQSSRRNILKVLSADESQLAGPRRGAFSTVAPTIWNIINPEIRSLVLTMLAFCKDLITWFCAQAWGPGCVS